MRITLYASMVLCLLFAGAVFGDGEPDPTFGVRGRVLTDFSHNNSETGIDVVAQSDGKLIVAGNFCNENGKYNFALARYRINGLLDQQFGRGGKMVTDFNGRDDMASAVAVDTQGRIVVVGTSYAGNRSDIAVARFMPDGFLDRTFGNQGRVLTDLGTNDVALAARLQGDSVVVAGSTNGVVGHDAFVLRYSPAGKLDRSFGDGGVTRIDAQSYDSVSAIAFDASSIVLAGTSTPNNGYDGRYSHDFLVIRIKPDGTLDPTFGGHGFVLTDFHDDSDNAVAVVVRKNGYIAVAGSTNTYGGPAAFGLVMYKTDGSLNTTFGRKGKLQIFGSSGTDAADLLIDSSGRFLLSGSIQQGSNRVMAVTRVMPGGTMDSSFGTNGKKTIPLSGGQVYGGAMVFQKDKLVLAGTFHKQDENGYLDTDFLLLRLLLN